MQPIQLSDRASAVLAAIALASFSTRAAAQTYRVTDLGVLPGHSFSHPAGINASGQVVGTSQSRPVLFDHGAVTDLGTLPGGTSGAAVAINDTGQVVGDSQFANGGAIRHATLFDHGTLTDLGVLPLSGNYSRATGINASTVVVGWTGPSSSTNSTRAFVWDAANGMRDIGTLGGGFARANAINDSGVVTGAAEIGTGFNSFHAFTWTDAGGMQDLGTIAGSTSWGNFVNANGRVVGRSTINAFDNRAHAFLWDGAMHDLGAIGDNDFFSDRSEAFGVNVHDVVVGTTYRPYQGGALYQIAFVHRGGQMLDLETLVDASGSDYRLYRATAINDAGQIAVEAIRISTNELHAVLLTPNAVSAFCSGDGSATACPCAPASTPGAGCVNSTGTGGLLAGGGTASVSADSLTLSASGLPASASTLFFQGTAQQGGGLGVVFGDGLRCIGGSILRLGTKTASAGVVAYPSAGDATVSVRGLVPATGGVRHYQAWYRNAATFCTASTFNLTNGLSVTWTP